MEFGLHSTHKGDQAIRGLHSAQKGWSPYGLSGAIDYNFCCLHGQITLKSLMSWVEPHNRWIIKTNTFCYLYSQITLKSLMSWVEPHNKSIIKNKTWSPYDLIPIILLCFLLPVLSNYIEIPYELIPIDHWYLEARYHDKIIGIKS